MAIAPDPLVGLVAYLLADPDVTSLAGTRVYGAELPEMGQPVPDPSVVIQDAGGFGRRGNSPEYHQRVDVVAYAATPEQAKQLQLACIGALRTMPRVVVAQTIFYSVVMESGPNAGRSPTALWPYSFSTWSVQTNYQRVT